MFDLLTKYLLEYKKLAIPYLGVFELKPKQANNDLIERAISAPGWTVAFQAAQNPVDALHNDELYNWLAANGNIARSEVFNKIDSFGKEIDARLLKEEEVIWPGLGVLIAADHTVKFIPAEASLLPFTNVAARKVVRENTSHTTLVGDKETTTAKMREQLLPDDEPRRQGNIILWVLVAVAAIAAIWYFAQNGCNKAATGNRQKVEAAKPGDTYKLK
ncbi:MAG: hypothetical protein QM640_05095 [Niabella sp.]